MRNANDPKGGQSTELYKMVVQECDVVMLMDAYDVILLPGSRNIGEVWVH